MNISAIYSHPSLKGHSLERTPLSKGHKFLTASTRNACGAPSHQRTPLIMTKFRGRRGILVRGGLLQYIVLKTKSKDATTNHRYNSDWKLVCLIDCCKCYYTLNVPISHVCTCCKSFVLVSNTCTISPGLRGSKGQILEPVLKDDTFCQKMWSLMAVVSQKQVSFYAHNKDDKWICNHILYTLTEDHTAEPVLKDQRPPPIGQTNVIVYDTQSLVTGSTTWKCRTFARKRWSFKTGGLPCQWALKTGFTVVLLQVRWCLCTNYCCPGNYSDFVPLPPSCPLNCSRCLVSSPGLSMVTEWPQLSSRLTCWTSGSVSWRTSAPDTWISWNDDAQSGSHQGNHDNKALWQISFQCIF